MDRRGLLEELDAVVYHTIINVDDDIEVEELATRIVDELQEHPNLLMRLAIRAQNAELERERKRNAAMGY